MVCATTATFTIVYYHHHAGKLLTLIIFGWFSFAVMPIYYDLYNCQPSPSSSCIRSLFRLRCGDAMSGNLQLYDSGRHLWRTALCRHGPDCSYPGCRFAHRLCDLRRPDETVACYTLQWEQGHIDRFYGQTMPIEQLRRIRMYFVNTPICDLPLWAIGLHLISTRQEAVMGFAYSWDFGLVQDFDDLIEARYVRGRPFCFWANLWDRLQQRRRVLLSYQHPPHSLGLRAPTPIASMAPTQRARSRSTRRPMVAPQAISPSIRRSVSPSRETSRSGSISSSSPPCVRRRRGPRGPAVYPDDHDL